MLDESADGVDARLAYQSAEVVTDQPSGSGGRGDWSGFGTGVTTEGIHALGEISGLPTDKQWIRFGFAARRGGASVGFGQADISAMYQVKPCGRVVGEVNVAGLEVEAPREIAISDWFETVDVTDVRIGYLVDADASFLIDWYIQTADDTNRPNQPASIGATQVAGSGAGSYVSGNTGDIDISGTTSPASPTSTPAWARIMARLTTSGGAVSADQFLTNVQVK